MIKNEERSEVYPRAHKLVKGVGGAKPRADNAESGADRAPPRACNTKSGADGMYS